MNKKCVVCGKMMYDVYPTRKYCSRSCAREVEKAKLRAKTAEKNKDGKVCEKCGQHFMPKPNGWTRKYCFDCMPDGTRTRF